MALIRSASAFAPARSVPGLYRRQGHAISLPPFFLWVSRAEPKRLKLFEGAAFYLTLLAGAFFFVGLGDGVMVMRYARQAQRREARAH